MFIFPIADKSTPDQFKKTAPKCTTWVPNSIRRWYVNFMKHAKHHFIYVHPLYCLSPQSKNPKGFTVGTTTDTAMQNLPDLLIHRLSAWSSLIYNTLAKDGMFAAESAGDVAVKQGFYCSYELLNRLV